MNKVSSCGIVYDHCDVESSYNFIPVSFQTVWSFSNNITLIIITSESINELTLI